MIITSLGNSERLANLLAKQLHAHYSPLTIDYFPDHELYLKFNSPVHGRTVVLVQSFQPHPQATLVRVLFAAKTAKDLGAKKVILAAPYLAFMRQDKRFNQGECISSKVVAELLNKSIDKIVTIDPHLHRYKTLKDIFTINAEAITANNLIGDYLKKHFPQSVVIGPDRESRQWAEAIARKAKLPVIVLEKTRFSSRHVAVKTKEKIEISGRTAVIVDDVISTGHTIAEAARQAKKLGAGSIAAIAVHGLFAEKAIKIMKNAGINKIITSNSIEHATNKINVAPLLANALKNE